MKGGNTDLRIETFAAMEGVSREKKVKRKEDGDRNTRKSQPY